MHLNKSITFGSAGFIGKHLSCLLGSDQQNYDIKDLTESIKFCDVRKKIITDAKDAEVIYNLAAIHTTPGHDYKEYYETNILGAQNICDFARKNEIKTIVFLSSIAPYGSWEEKKTEKSLPIPTSAYGNSKLIAEYIHKLWQSEDKDRKLIILRPGVVFGKGENGNFTRLYNAMKKGLFFFPGRKDTIKASIYVKDLVNIMVEAGEKEQPGAHTYNASFSPTPTIAEITRSIADITGVKNPKRVIPSILLKIGAGAIYPVGKLFRMPIGGIHPARVKKLMISTNICGQKINNNYKFNFNLSQAILDWYIDCDEMGLF